MNTLLNNHSPINPNLQYLQKKKKKPFTCKCCSKEYKTEPNLHKHLLLCEILHKIKTVPSTNSSNQTETNSILPSPLPNKTQLYQIIQELVMKQNKMEEKIEEMQKWINLKKKKMNITEWLNQHKQPDINFKNLVSQFVVEERDIDFIYKPDNTMLDLMNILWERNVYETQSIPILPIFASLQKNNILYYYDFDSTQNQFPYQWKELPKDKLTSIMNQIHSKILNVLMDWKKKNHDFIHSNDKNELLYCKMMSKFMSIDFKQPVIINKLYSHIYNKIKTDMTTYWVEYEIS